MKKICLLNLLLALVVSPALAEGMYVGVKLGQVNYDYVAITNNNQAAIGFLAGFFINSNTAVEVEYNNLGGFEDAKNHFTGGAFSLSGIGSITLNSQFSLFGKLGLASTTLDGKAKPGFVGEVGYSNTGLNLGLGTQYNISPSVGVRAGLDNFKVGDAASKTARARMLYMGAIFKM